MGPISITKLPYLLSDGSPTLFCHVGVWHKCHFSSCSSQNPPTFSLLTCSWSPRTVILLSNTSLMKALLSFSLPPHYSLETAVFKPQCASDSPPEPVKIFTGPASTPEILIQQTGTGDWQPKHLENLRTIDLSYCLSLWTDLSTTSLPTHSTLCREATGQGAESSPRHGLGPDSLFSLISYFLGLRPKASAIITTASSPPLHASSLQLLMQTPLLLEPSSNIFPLQNVPWHPQEGQLFRWSFHMFPHCTYHTVTAQTGTMTVPTLYPNINYNSEAV